MRPEARFEVLGPTCGVRRTGTALMAWFGIRGIGSLHYLAYATTHGLAPARAEEAAWLTLSVVAVSILAHGATATPALDRYERGLTNRAGA